MQHVRTALLYSVLLMGSMIQADIADYKINYIGEPVEAIQAAFNTDPAWGLCSSIDLRGCKYLMHESPESKAAIERFVAELCDLIDMNTYGDPQVVWFGTGGVQGYTLIQLIETSCISAHWAGDRMFLDIFSCKFYDPYKAIEYVKNFFQAEDVSVTVCMRS